MCWLAVGCGGPRHSAVAGRPLFGRSCRTASLGRAKSKTDLNARHALPSTPATLACRDQYFACGILHMTNAVSFLNNDCKLVRSGSG